MLALLQDAKPLIVTIVDKPAREMTVLDLFLNSFSLTVVAVLTGVILGGVLGLLLLRLRHRHPPEMDHLPSISPLVPDPHRPPTSPTR
jgi:ABC-type Fe3+ transport system permease subunit